MRTTACLAALATVASGVPYEYYYNTDCTVNPTGPYCWPKTYNTVPTTVCAGTSQSPINIAGATASHKLEAPKFATKAVCQTVTFFNNNHTIEASMEGCPLLTAEFNGTEYELQQLHLHSPSEHTIGGASYEGELHMVHYNTLKKKYMVVGVLLNSPSSSNGAVPGTNAFIDRMLGAKLDGTASINPLTGLANKATADFNTNEEKTVNFVQNFNPYAEVLPGNPTFYSYSGSFTTPPCTEAVDWVLMSTPVTVGASQMEHVRKYLAASTKKAAVISNIPGVTGQYRNNRPVQKLNERTVTLEMTEEFESEAAEGHEDNETFWYSGMLKPVGELFGFIGVLVMIVGVAIAFFNLFLLGVQQVTGRAGIHAFFSNSKLSLSVVRVQFAKAVILSLEILVAADVIDTLAKPVEAQTFTQLGLISMIVVIRTVLSLHLGHELHQIKEAHGGHMNTHDESTPLNPGHDESSSSEHSNPGVEMSGL